jgi:hypothetical protein
MKKTFNILCAFFIALTFPFVSTAQKISEKPKQLWTLEQVKEMAKKYNLQDSITTTKRFFLVYVNKQFIDKYLQDEAKAIRAKAELRIYLEKTKSVRTYEDYTNLVNSLPTIREGIVSMHGGEFKHQIYVRDALKFKWRIYRKDQGALSFERADLPFSEDELSWGVRLDTLAKD